MNLWASSIDTIEFYSEAFKENRTVYIHKPATYQYQSKEAKLPVIYILDGQHEWLINPMLNGIKYLEYTHEIPEAIIVVIPLKNRYKECMIKSLSESEILPLHNFITKDLAAKMDAYSINGFNLLIGHSFSASFALYSYLNAPQFYTAIFSHSPLDKLESLILKFKEKGLALNNVFISVGGLAKSKDYHHRNKHNELKSEYPHFFEKITYYQADKSRHNAVPIVANPSFLTALFNEYSMRYSEIALVDFNYKLIELPKSLEEEWEKIAQHSVFEGKVFPIGLADINGIASRYMTEESLKMYSIAMYKRGVELYPNYFEFHAYLGELLLEEDKKQGLYHLNKALKLIETIEMKSGFLSKEDREAAEEEIRELLKDRP